MRLPCDTLSVSENTADQPAPPPDIHAAPSAESYTASTSFCRTHRFPTHLMTCFTPFHTQIHPPRSQPRIFILARGPRGPLASSPAGPLKIFSKNRSDPPKQHPATHHMTHPCLLPSQIQQIVPSRSQTKKFILPRGPRGPLAPGRPSR